MFASSIKFCAVGLGHCGRYLSDLLLPPCCLACRDPLTEHGLLCPRCWTSLRFIRPPVCDRLGIPLPAGSEQPLVSYRALAAPPDYDRARAAAHFDGCARHLIHALKFDDRHEVVPLLVQLTATAAAPLACTSDLVMPVPLARWRMWQRRFNQSALIGRGVARQLGLPFDVASLQRHRATRSQIGLSHAERRDNVAEAFRLRDNAAVAGKRILLVDDVITTGATANACARALKQAGAAAVHVAAVARVVHDGEAML